MADVREIPVFIYALTEPDSGVVRYVGKSSNPHGRVASHMAKSAARAVRNWIESLGCRPGLVILHRVDPGCDADTEERRYIEHFREHGQIVNDGRVPGWAALKRSNRRSLGALRLAGVTVDRGGQRTVARTVGVDAGVVSRWVNGERKPAARLRGALESVYGIGWELWDQYAEAAE